MYVNGISSHSVRAIRREVGISGQAHNHTSLYMLSHASQMLTTDCRCMHINRRRTDASRTNSLHAMSFIKAVISVCAHTMPESHG